MTEPKAEDGRAIEARPPELGSEAELKARLSKLERRDITLWTTAVTVLVLVCVALTVAPTVPIIFREADIQYKERVDVAMRALVGILLLFSTFAIYQQITIRRMRKRMIWQIEMLTALQTRADLYAKLAVLDPLTELFNRRFADEHLSRELSRAVRMKYPLTLLLIDLNNFRALNERYGHVVGDSALRTFARELKKAVRNSDICVRTGGDEFLVMLPECQMYSVPTALSRLRNVRVTIEGEEIPVTFAAGWAEMQPGDTAEELVARADRALYADKQTGASQNQAQRVAAAAERGEKLQLVGQLTGQVAHDFNNLLAIIKGYSEMTLHILQASDPARGKVEQIARAADQATHLTSQLLAFTRTHSQQMRIVDVNERVQEVQALVEPLFGKRIQLAVMNQASCKVPAQGGQIEQILMNLVTNAREAMPQGGEITISTRDTVLDEAFIREHPGSRAGRFVALSVRDTGTGMDEDTRSHVFEPYFTTKPDGTGLGLATVFGVVKQMGGYIEVESAPNAGSTFTAYLPVYEEHVEKQIAAAELKRARRKAYVLVVEGLDALRDMMAEALRESGCEVMTAISAEQGLEIAAQSPHPIDVAVCDVLLTGMSCRQLTQELVHRHPGIRMVYVGGGVADPIWSAGLEQMGHLLETPFQPDTLVETVRGLHARHRPVPASMA